MRRMGNYETICHACYVIHEKRRTIHKFSQINALIAIFKKKDV